MDGAQYLDSPVVHIYSNKALDFVMSLKLLFVIVNSRNIIIDFSY
jgi:hypothetical protein